MGTDTVKLLDHSQSTNKREITTLTFVLLKQELPIHIISTDKYMCVSLTF